MVIMILSYKPLVSLHVVMKCMSLVVPDMDSRVTCTDMDLYKLLGFPMDSHTFALVGRMRSLM